ncbi:MAG: uroporphyrinogen-III synthase [Xanthomonadales bacterium]|jgi:uroporphyrinogen-III synthase|nr:uroporphyrinogen-III synthase [Xanthomonadales bacterium]
MRKTTWIELIVAGKQRAPLTLPEGYNHLELPLLEAKTRRRSRELMQSIASAALSDPDWIFPSSAAVRAIVELEPDGLAAPVRVWAVGRSTAESLREAGREQVLCPAEGADSEALYAALKLETGEAGFLGRRYAIFCAPEGRTWLAEQLTGAGATAELIHVYLRSETRIPRPLTERWKRVHANAIYSAGSSELLAMASQKLALLGVPKPWTVPMLVYGPRLQKLAEQLGWSHVVRLQNPSREAVLAALAGLR